MRTVATANRECPVLDKDAKPMEASKIQHRHENGLVQGDGESEATATNIIFARIIFGGTLVRRRHSPFRVKKELRRH